MPSPGFHAHAAAVMRSLLFVPADDGKKLDKAMASGADAVIVDLEDSIPAQGKADARMRAAAFITDAVKAAQRPRLLVRINGFTTGLAGAYGGASARLEGLTWGAEDLSAELGAEANRDSDGRFLDPYRLARALCLAGAAAARAQ